MSKDPCSGVGLTKVQSLMTRPVTKSMTPSSPTILLSKRVILSGESSPVPASLWIQDGKIERVDRDQDILNRSNELHGAEVLDVGHAVIMSGLVDTHAHINEPGRTEWEGFQTATRAAAAGGITTVVDMPLNSIPATTSHAAFNVKRQAAEGNTLIDYGFWGGLIPGNFQELPALVEAGVMGFKCFLIDSGVPEFPSVDEALLREVMPHLARYDLPLIVHAELESPVKSPSQFRRYQHYLDSRPSQWEVDAVRLMIKLAAETSCRVHIVHLSAADALDEIRKAKKQGIPITAETCPHYLFFTSEEIEDGLTQFKCAPPIRERANRERLWEGLQEGVIDFIVSDHSPCIPELKCQSIGDFNQAWGGISGLQFSLSVVWTEMKRRDLSINQLSRWMSERTAHFIGLDGKKGSLVTGADADFIVWDPEQETTLTSQMVLHRHSLTPYDGCKLSGRVLKTFVRGIQVYGEGIASDAMGGEFISRSLIK